MTRIAIVEDEKEAADVLIQCLERYRKENGGGLAWQWFPSAVAFLDGYRGDFQLIFMDVDMPELNGMEAAHRLREADQDVALIFVTNLAQYAIEGYEVGALDYILKPVNYYSFKLKLQKGLDAARRRMGQHITVQRAGGTDYIDAVQLCYIEVQNHDLVYHTTRGAVRATGSLKQVEKQLDEESFFRCNYCYLVNLRHVSKVEENEVTVGGDVLQISRSRRKEFLRRLSLFYGKGGR